MNAAAVTGCNHFGRDSYKHSHMDSQLTYKASRNMSYSFRMASGVHECRQLATPVYISALLGIDEEQLAFEHLRGQPRDGLTLQIQESPRVVKGHSSCFQVFREYWIDFFLLGKQPPLVTCITDACNLWKVYFLTPHEDADFPAQSKG
ncbi:hypothetical protein GOP47_0024644 [Adiantum capillus-veneris]|uniref:Uncharacterized protein n=1 Tax=Adiantum capillus-veneris TaxID=13818 RepID=A0A9D4U4F3_ADICA|nr:hypothetical protein GOP47_0024644 [Adiantum capillus-veneris]